jgi:NAD-dependent SIR2 family protein deacetylase
MKAHEYLDSPEVLQHKVKCFADLVRKSQNCVAYTGAGISTASGIGDWASKAEGSVAGVKRKISIWEAQPTLAHRVLVAMHKAGRLKHWVQQNHDGLPQKAGFPQDEINEIHGAHYDPSNPVVPMDRSLRPDLMKRLLDWQDRADLCIALGTSMVGMNSDRMAVMPGDRARKGLAGALGTVIVSLQQTQYDSISSLRIFATIDQVMEMLAAELALDIPPAPVHRPWSEAPVLRDLPYGADGERCTSARLTLDFRLGAKYRVVEQTDWDFEKYGNTCEVVASADAIAPEGHISLVFRGETRVLGRWWLDAAVAGSLKRLPLVPCE